MNNIPGEKGIQVGHHKNGRLGFIGTPDNADGIVIVVGGHLVDLGVGEPLHEKKSPFFFFEGKGRGLSDQDDIGNNSFLDGLQGNDVFR